MEKTMEQQDSLSVVVMGASGDLARKKILPAFFALYSQGLLPANFHVFGFARSAFTHAEFREKIREHLTCRYVPDHACDQRIEEFLARCFYVSGRYESRESCLELYDALRRVEGGRGANRIFYLSIPSSVASDTARAVAGAGFVSCGAAPHWSRVVVEKPFGHDRDSSDLLSRELEEVFGEEQTYRIDHYLGKEVVQNLLVLRFANLIFEPIWNREHVDRIAITWKEDLGVEGRGGYFDRYGIVRDVMQNHLLQILALVAMEPPGRLDANAIRGEKVRLLRRVKPLGRGDVVLGQYAAGERSGRRMPGYREDPSVSPASNTPTYAAAALQIDNERWRGVPVWMEAGKGLDERKTEIRIRFRKVPGNLFCDAAGCPPSNELVIRVQPDEAIYFTVINKVPGVEFRLAPKLLDLQYKEAFPETIPEAYEDLLLDVIRGEKSTFIGNDELAAAWDVFTPVLHDIDRRDETPEAYPFFSQGPAGTAGLAARWAEMQPVRP